MHAQRSIDQRQECAGVIDPSHDKNVAAFTAHSRGDRAVRSNAALPKSL